MSQTIVRDESTLHRYRTEIPNVVFTLGLTPFELTLYLHLKRTAGECGECWKSVVTLAKETGMSAGMIGPAKDGLLKERAEIGGKSLISLCQQPNPKGGRARHIITITDVWPENMAQFAPGRQDAADPLDTSSPHELATPPHEVQPPAPQNQPSQVHHLKFTSSPPELKKNPSEEEEKNPGDIRMSPAPKGRASPRIKPLKMSIPNVEEVRAYFTEIGCPEETEEFMDHYRANGWLVGGRTAMRDWKASARNWKRNPLRARKVNENGNRSGRNGNGAAPEGLAPSKWQPKAHLFPT